MNSSSTKKIKVSSTFPTDHYGVSFSDLEPPRSHYFRFGKGFYVEMTKNKIRHYLKNEQVDAIVRSQEFGRERKVGKGMKERGKGGSENHVGVVAGNEEDASFDSSRTDVEDKVPKSTGFDQPHSRSFGCFPFFVRKR